jgi:DNA-binding CsgD family transcriptional regulator
MRLEEKYSSLNNRQRDIILLIIKGMRNREIARRLGISEGTVKWYVSQLLLIFEVKNRTELIGKILPILPAPAENGNS